MKPLSRLLDWPNPTARVILVVVFQWAVLSTTSSAQFLGAEGVLLQGEKISSEHFFQFLFDTKVGETYPIAVSTDLINWRLLTNVVESTDVEAPGAPLWVEDQEASKFPQRFYRIGLPPTPVTNMVFISPGTFTMGSSASEAGHESREEPQTIVTLSRGFWMGKYEVTQAEYIAVMGTNIALFTWDHRLPVDSVKFFEATNYCYALTAQERAAGRLPAGYSYRLPTEAEWEYACRAGTTTPFGVGDGISLGSTQANFDGGFPYGGAAPGPFVSLTTLGGTYAPNAWGLHDMHGNLWEWCQDWYGLYPGGQVTDPKGPVTGSAHVLRGGGLSSTGQGCRSAKRDSRSPVYGNSIQGFRVVLALDP